MLINDDIYILRPDGTKELYSTPPPLYGSIVTSTLPVNLPEYHLLDGSIIDGVNYEDFISYVDKLYNSIAPTPEYLAYFNKIGAPTISSDYIATGAVGSGIVTPSVMPIQTADSWEIKTTYTYKGGGATPAVFGHTGTADFKSPVLYVVGGVFKICLSSTGTAWNIVTQGSTNITAVVGTTYRFKVGFTGTRYYVSYNTDGGEDYTEVWSLNSTVKSFCSVPFYFLNLGLNANYYNLGTMDLKETSITINNTLFWQAVETYESREAFIAEKVWQNTVNIYGACGKYVYDSINKTVRLPKVLNFIESTTSVEECGDIISAGLPNIVGDIDFVGRNGFFNIIANMTGAFTKNKTLLAADIPSVGQIAYIANLNLDASRSNSIYGNSTTVQPQSIKYLQYVYLGKYTF